MGMAQKTAKGEGEKKKQKSKAIELKMMRNRFGEKSLQLSSGLVEGNSGNSDENSRIFKLKKKNLQKLWGKLSISL